MITNELIKEYYRLFIHSEAQKFTIASMDNSQIKYPHQQNYLTDKDLISSIKGDKSLGLILCQNKTGLAKCGCVDIDIPRDCSNLSEALTIAQNLVKQGSELGINLYIEFSGNRGFHVWLFVEKAVTYEIIKKVLTLIALRVNFTPQEVYPKDYQSNIKLPCTTHLKTSLRCGFIGSNFDVNNPEVDLSSQVELMANIAQNDVIDILECVNSLNNSYSDNSYSQNKPVNRDEVTNKLNLWGIILAVLSI